VSSQQTRKVALPKIELISPRQYQHGPASSPQRPIASANVASQTVLAENSSNPNNWVVQAGSFAVAGNASLLRDQLRARNFPASLGTVNVDGRTLYRVNVGPYTSRTESEQARQRLLREASVSGSVRPM
jgi:cell division septation protein DedD